MKPFRVLIIGAAVWGVTLALAFVVGIAVGSTGDDDISIFGQVRDMREKDGELQVVIDELIQPYRVRNVVGWALEEFDPEILRECLAQYDLPPAPVMPQQVPETTVKKLGERSLGRHEVT